MKSPLLFASIVSAALAVPAGAQVSQANAAVKFPVKNSTPSNQVTQQPTMSALVGGNDNCATPDVIAGQGSFAVDTTAATTGAVIGTCGIMTRDVWFAWTPSITGNAIVTACNGITGLDSVLTAWPNSPGVCPTAGTQIVCNDDTCGLESRISFAVTAGTTYLLEFGVYNTTTAYNGTFTTSVSVPSGNDTCALPQALVGNGPFAYDNSLATTGAEGQTEGACLFFATTGITNDLWFTWTSTFSGAASVALCGSAGDTKLAAYAGAGCPTGAALACNDDSCGLQSLICFPVTNGSTYTFQVGNYPGGLAGPGTLLITPQTIPTGCQYDNGSTENSLGLTNGGALMWLQRFGTIGQNATVSSVSTAWGSVAFGGSPIDGTAVNIAVYEDPNDDGDPTDGVLLTQVSGVLVGANTDNLQTFTLGSPVSVSGIYFVAAEVAHIAGQFPGPLDQDSCPAGSGGRAWFCGDTTGTLNFTSLGSNNVPPLEMDAAGFPGVWLLRAGCSGAIAPQGFCFGDGTGSACPCGNVGAAGNGCANSVNAAGGHLGATGAATISNDTLVLQGSGMPNSSALYFQGTTQLAGTVFGDGLRCAGGAVIRLGTKSNAAGASSYPVGADLKISTKGLVTLPGTRTYQCWYRNSAAFCTVSTFNLTNGLLVTWN